MPVWRGASYFAFDELGRLTAAVTPRGDATYFGYDPVSSLLRLQFPRDGKSAYFGYDGARRMKAALSPGGKAAYYRYDASSNLSKRRLGNGAATYFAYDKADRVTSIRHLKSDGAPIAYFDYGRDAAGRITKIARENGIAVYYTYDDIDRLVAELWRKQSDNSQVYAFWYDYDAANNRTRMRREGAGGAETESAYYWYDAANGMTERRVYTPGSGWVDTYYYYDLNGGRTALVEGGQATYYAYGPHGFPTRIKPPNEAATYFYYDGKLNRYCIDLAGTPTYFLWEGLNLLEERNADGSLKARYTHGYSPIEGIGSIVEAERHTATATYFQYLHMDHRSTVYAVTDENENIQIDYTQDAFGRELSAPGGADPNIPNDSIYQTNWKTITVGGKRYELSPSRIREPSTDQYLERDPLHRAVAVNLKAGGNALGIYDETLFGIVIERINTFSGLNLYAAFRTNPLLYVDPSGFFPEWLARLLGGTFAHQIIETDYAGDPANAGGQKFLNRSVKTIANQGWGLNNSRGADRFPDIAHVGKPRPCQTSIYEIKPTGSGGSGSTQPAKREAIRIARGYMDALNEIAMAFHSLHRARLGKTWPLQTQFRSFCPRYPVDLVYWAVARGAILYRYRRKQCRRKPRRKPIRKPKKRPGQPDQAPEVGVGVFVPPNWTRWIDRVVEIANELPEVPATKPQPIGPPTPVPPEYMPIAPFVEVWNPLGGVDLPGPLDNIGRGSTVVGAAGGVVAGGIAIAAETGIMTSVEIALGKVSLEYIPLLGPVVQQAIERVGR